MPDQPSSETGAYLRRLERTLHVLPAVERAQLVAEVRGHLAERRERSGEGAAAAMGRPERLGRALLRARRPSLARRLAAHARLAVRRLSAAGVMLASGLLGALALALTLVAAAKPFAPANVGLWTAPHHLVFGLVSAPESSGAERLGLWIMPLALGAAAALAASAYALAVALRYGGRRMDAAAA